MAKMAMNWQAVVLHFRCTIMMNQKHTFNANVYWLH